MRRPRRRAYSAKPACGRLYPLEDFAGTDMVAAISRQPCMEKPRHRAQQRAVTDLRSRLARPRKCWALESSCRSNATQAWASGSEAGTPLAGTPISSASRSAVWTSSCLVKLSG